MSQGKNGFMVFKKGKTGKKPKLIHKTLGEAIKEAQRLSTLHPKEIFYILEIVGKIRFINGKHEYE